MLQPRQSHSIESRVEVLRVLADEGRLRVLALCAEQELNINELCEVLRDSQSQMSRKASALRQAGLLLARKEGPRTFLRPSELITDPLVAEALNLGRSLVESDGCLAALPSLLLRREATGVAYFDDDAAIKAVASSTTPHAAYLGAIAPLFGARHCAVDVGCGDGAFLDVLSPLFDRVIAVDRSRSQLARAQHRIAERGYSNISFHEGRFDDVEVLRRVDQQRGADLVVCSRVLHHMANPEAALQTCARLLKPGGHIVVVDYRLHDDEKMREQGDVWLGFDLDVLRTFLNNAGFDDVQTSTVPTAFRINTANDGHLPWFSILARRRRAGTDIN